MQRAVIVSIDDHELFRHGIGLIVKNTIKDAKFYSFSSVQDALSHEYAVAPIFLLDEKMPQVSGLAALPLLKSFWSDCRIILVTSDEDEATRAAALEAGADNVIHKSDSLDHLVAAIAHFLPGEKAPVRRELSPRQIRVLQLLDEGFTNKAIARQLALSEFTVRGHVQALLKILGVTNRTEAVFAARKAGHL